jgi:hypothetical protein
MKRKHMEEANALLLKRAEEEKNNEKNKESVVGSTFKKQYYTDKLMKQLGNKK